MHFEFTPKSSKINRREGELKFIYYKFIIFEIINSNKIQNMISKKKKRDSKYNLLLQIFKLSTWDIIHESKQKA